MQEGLRSLKRAFTISSKIAHCANLDFSKFSIEYNFKWWIYEQNVLFLHPWTQQNKNTDENVGTDSNK